MFGEEHLVNAVGAILLAFAALSAGVGQVAALIVKSKENPLPETGPVWAAFTTPEYLEHVGKGVSAVALLLVAAGTFVLTIASFGLLPVTAGLVLGSLFWGLYLLFVRWRSGRSGQES